MDKDIMIMTRKHSPNNGRVIVGLILIVAIIAILFLAYWFLPVRTFTYEANGQQIFSIKYPLRFSGTVTAYSDYIDIGKSKEVKGDPLIHFIYSSGAATTNDQSYASFTSCADLDKNEPYADSPDYIAGYKSQQIDGKTVCYLDYEQTMDSDARAAIILNPTPVGVLSILYPKDESFQANLMLETMKFNQ